MKLTETEKYKQREMKYVSEYVAKFYPRAKVFFKQRIGKALPELEKELGELKAHRMYNVFRRWADAIVIWKREMILIEGKLKADPKVIGQLLLYRSIVKDTPELVKYKDYPLHSVLLTPYFDRDTERLCAEYGIEIVRYIPDWLEEYLEHLQHYWSGEYRKKKGLKELKGGLK